MIDEEDFPFDPVFITDEEAELLPPTEQPEEPSEDQVKETLEKKAHEKIHGHPAFATKEKYRARGEKVD